MFKVAGQYPDDNGQVATGQLATNLFERAGHQQPPASRLTLSFPPVPPAPPDRGTPDPRKASFRRT